MVESLPPSPGAVPSPPCSCGSGKTWATCHGTAGVGSLGGGKPSTKSIPADQLGEPGTYQELWIEGEPVGPGGAPMLGTGPWSVRALLCRYGTAIDTTAELTLGQQEGDSHFVVGGGTGPALGLWAQVDARGSGGPLRRVVITGYANKAGRLGLLLVNDIDAPNARDARTIAYDMLAPYVAKTSFDIDAPMWIWKLETRCTRTGALHVDYRAPYRDSRPPLALNEVARVNRVCQGALALYLEALASTSANYSFLCFFRAAELILAFRTRLARQRGGALARSATAFPRSTPELHEHQEVLGRPFEAVLREDGAVVRARGEIGHGISVVNAEADPHTPSYRFLYGAEARRLLPIVKFAARALISEELSVGEPD